MKRGRSFLFLKITKEFNFREEIRLLQDYSILRIPGPTPVPPSVQQAMTKQMIGHRGKETKELIQSIRPKVQKVFGTKEEVVLISGSGTAALETAVVNLASAGDEVLVVITGSFGDRFVKICETYGLKTHIIAMEWGEALDPEAIKAYLLEHPAIKAVYVTFCETSTGVINPIEEVCKVIHDNSEALVVVDGVSCVGAVPTEMDKWGIDVLATGSQKAFMLPPGLALLSLSARAWDVVEANEQPRFYLDLRTYKKNLEADGTPYTPALSIMYGLEQALNLLEDEGLENVYARHKLMKEMVRGAFKALNLPLLTTDENASETVTAVKPEHFKAEDLRKILKEQFNLSIAGGQQHLAGHIFRVGHMGYCAPADVLQYISLIELALVQLDQDITLGQGVGAAQAIYLQSIK